MNRTELVNVMAEKAEIPKKDAEKALVAFMNTVKETLAAGEPVQLVGFGTFDVTNVKERTARNPKDGSDVFVPAHKKIRFKIGKALKDSVN